MTIYLANILDKRLSSQNTRNGISGHRVFKIFWASNPIDPLGLAHSAPAGFIWSLKNIPNLHIQMVGQSGISDQSFRRGASI